MTTAAAPVPAATPALARSSPAADVLALARIEGRCLVLHPAFLAGVLLSVAFIVFYRLPPPSPRASAMLVSGYAVMPLAAGTLIAANLGALRSRRDNTDELYASLPHRRSTRTAGQLAALVWTLPIAGVLLAGAYAAVSAGGSGRSPGLFEGAAVVELAQGPLVVIALGAVGIMLARVAPVGIAAVLLIVAGFFLEYELTFWIVGQESIDGRSPAWLHWLAPMANDAVETARPCPAGATMPGASPPQCQRIQLDRDVAGLTWHVAWLAAATILTGAAALVRSLRARAALVAMTALLAVASALAAG